MIKWECNFKIPNATTQVATAILKVVSLETDGDNTNVTIHIYDEECANLIIEQVETFDHILGDDAEIYNQLLSRYQPGILI